MSTPNLQLPDCQCDRFDTNLPGTRSRCGNCAPCRAVSRGAARARVAREERAPNPRRVDAARRAAESCRESRGHRQERRLPHHDVREARIPGFTVADQRLAGRLRAPRRRQRAGHAALLHALRRSAIQPEGVDARRPLQPAGVQRQDAGRSGRGRRSRRSERPHLWAIDVGRQGPDRRVRRRARRLARHEGQHPVEHSRASRR